MGGHRSRWWRSRTLILKYTWIVLLCILDLSASTLSLTINQEDFLFTQKLYNATIPEMAPGKTFVKSEKKMGIFISDPKISVIYKIEDGDKSGIFKCEEVRVGDFVFLRVRTLSNSFGSLNRELESRYHLRIKAIGQISQGNSVTTTTDLIINVLDKNDLYPLFDKDVYNTTISEDTDLFTSVLTVSASDGDVGVNSDIYYRFVQKTNAFAIHPTSGVITLTRRLDYFVQSRYNFDVVAEDRGPKSRGHNGFVSRFAKITILVSRANFFSPQISFKRLPILEDSGQENGHAGIVYAIMSVTDDDIDVNGKIDSVRILEDASGSFKIFPTNDIEQYELALVKKLTESKISNNFDIVIEATDRGDPPRSSTSRIPVNIHLLGQGRKLFAQEKFEAAILENIPVGSSVTYLRASDRDIGQTSGVEYEIVGGNDLKWFKVNKNTGLVTTAVPIDAESAKFVTLKVNALDLRGEGQALSNSVLVNVTILDCNDNSPVFSINETNIAFDENLEIGASVFSVKAVDADQGDNGKISYSITNTDKVPFTINHFNGTIMMSEVLDYETMKRLYKVKVRASDWGSPFQRESEIVLHFHLGDINDNKPRFEKVDCSGYISREADVGTEVITVPAIDFDYNVLSYYIISGNDDLCFTMDTISGTLILNCSMSEETANERVIVVGVRDDKYEADPVTITLTLVNTKKNLQLSNKDANVQCHQTNASQELTRLLQISRKNNQVADDSKMLETQNLEAQNIHAPVFNASMLIANDISENIAVGTTVLKVAAYDLDTGYNGLLKYSVIDGDPYDQFQINPSTGEISVVAKLDREQISRYDLEVLISDLAPVGLRKSSSAVISFNILDENDNVPKFEKESYEAKISEGILVNSTVIQVIARDDDLGRNGRVEYSLAADTNLFAVDPKNGIITVNKALDREVKDTYLIPIRAHDLGEKSQSATTTVKVTLLDVNDNVPKFIPEIYEIKLREDLPLGVVVATLKAEDLDLGENGKIKYQLLYGVEDTFEIDESTGIIRLVKALDFETRQVYNISAHASDGGRPPLMSACFVNIEVIDVNENVEPPVFEHFYEVGVIRENKSVGSVVMVISATDSDGPVDRNSNRSPVTYSIRDGSGLGFFTIDNDGTIRTSKVLDRETTDHYWLTVYATDRGIVPLHARLEVYIKVIDVNDNVPQFYKPVYYMEVEENSSPGRVVGQVQAYDKDDNPTQELSYSITDSDSTGGFAINSITVNEVLVEYANRNYTYREMSSLLAKNDINLSQNAIRKRLKACGQPSRRGPTVHSTSDVKRLIKSILEDHPKTVGYRFLTGVLHREGIHVRRDTVMTVLREIDPIGVEMRRRRRINRRVYSSIGANHVWHVDGYDKLKPFGFSIHGCIDGFSRRLMWLNVGSTNNDPTVVLQYFIQCVQNVHGFPLVLQADPGTENSDMGALQCTLRHEASDCFSGLDSFRVVKSTFNQRIEAWWSMFRRLKSEWWIHFFRDLEAFGLFHRGNMTELYCIRYCFMPVIQKDLDDLLEQWNDHYVSQSRQSVCPAGRPNIIHQLSSEKGGMDCLNNTTEEDEGLLRTLQHSVNRSGSDSFDSFAEQTFISKNWTDASEWKEALYQYVNLIGLS